MTPRTKAFAAACAALALAAAGCGSDDDEAGGGDGSSGGSAEQAEPSRLAIELSGTPKKPSFSVPDSIEGGVVEIEFTSSVSGEHSAQLVRAEDGHSAQEALAAGQAWGESGKPLTDLASNASAEFEVTGGSGGELAAEGGTITATEYAFESEGLTAGRSTVLFDNTGQEPHFIAAVGLQEGATLADAKRFFETEKGKPPFDESRSFGTAVVEGGAGHAVELDLDPGRYVLLCFIPDRAGGPPHVAKGMVSEAEVAE